MTEVVRSWHDFYVLVGTASATLAGLMFVTASIGGSIFTERSREAMGAFISPTVVHFAAALFLCILAIMPWHGSVLHSFLLVAVGLFGLLYSARLCVHLFVHRRFNVDVIDRLFYAGIPVLAYVAVVVAGLLLAVESAPGFDLLAAALITLMLAGIRNAWDMTIWIVIRVPVAEPASTEQSSPPPQ